MKKNNNTFVILVILLVSAFGFMAFRNKNTKASTPEPTKVAAPTVDQHGHAMPANIPAAPLTDLMNKPAPDFSLADKEGKVYSLNELRGKNIVLFFNEGLMCYPACWNQIVSLSKDERFKDSGTVALSVVVDSPTDWQKAIEKMPELAGSTVVFDKDTVVSKRFGTLTMASSMHYGSLPGHTYILINKEGIVRYVFDDPNMGIRNDELMAEINKM